MEYNAIFEINTGAKDSYGRMRPSTKYEAHKFNSRDAFAVMTLAFNMAQYYALTHPVDPDTKNNVIKVIQVSGPNGHIDQKSSGVTGYYEDNCLTVKYSYWELFLEQHKN